MEGFLLFLICGTITVAILYYTFKFSKKLMNFMKNIDLSGQGPLKQFLGLIFSEGKEDVLADINNLKISPIEFIQNNRHIFRSRDIDEDNVQDTELLFKTVLTYHLNLHNNFLILDYNHSGHDGLASINGLLNLNGIASIPATDEENAERGIHQKYITYDSRDYLDTFDLLIYISKILYRFDSTLIELNFEGDSFDIFVLPKSKISEVMELSKKLKIDITPMNILAFP